MPQCQAINCTNKPGKCSRSFFKFPDPEKGFEERKLCKKWIDNLKNGKLRIESFRSHRAMLVCDAHFTEDCFIGSFSSAVAVSLGFTQRKKSLKKGSVPTLVKSKGDSRPTESARKSADSIRLKRKKAQLKNDCHPPKKTKVHGDLLHGNNPSTVCVPVNHSEEKILQFHVKEDIKPLIHQVIKDRRNLKQENGKKMCQTSFKKLDFRVKRKTETPGICQTRPIAGSLTKLSSSFVKPVPVGLFCNSSIAPPVNRLNAQTPEKIEVQMSASKRKRTKSENNEKLQAFTLPASSCDPVETVDLEVESLDSSLYAKMVSSDHSYAILPDKRTIKAKTVIRTKKTHLPSNEARKLDKGLTFFKDLGSLITEDQSRSSAHHSEKNDSDFSSVTAIKTEETQSLDFPSENYDHFSSNKAQKFDEVEVAINVKTEETQPIPTEDHSHDAQKLDEAEVAKNVKTEETQPIPTEDHSHDTQKLGEVEVAINVKTEETQPIPTEDHSHDTQKFGEVEVAINVKTEETHPIPTEDHSQDAQKLGKVHQSCQTSTKDFGSFTEEDQKRMIYTQHLGKVDHDSTSFLDAIFENSDIVKEEEVVAET